MKLIDFLEQNQIPYQHYELFEEAFTHSSYINEHHQKHRDYQRLEFMGDAVLQLYVSEFLFKKYPKAPEGSMTTLRSKLVREESLARFAKELNIGEVIFFGQGEIKSGGRSRPSVLADVFEAMIGATYLDCGKDAVLQLLEKTIFLHVDDVNQEDIQDYKTILQELVQADARKTVTYELLASEGPSNAPTFTVAAMMDGMTLGVGSASSKKKAAQKAAHDALTKMAVVKANNE